MGNQAKQQVEVDFKASGLGKLKAQWADFAGELIEPMAILAAGGTKAQAAWAGLRGVFLTKVLGPLGMVTGAATGLLLVTRKLVAEWRQVGLQGAKAVETLTLQFKPLLGSLELARKRAREVFDFTVKSPFRFEEVAEGNKMLEALTKGALAAEEGMTLVGDAAAVSGQAFTDVARQAGRLYDGLMAGRPVGEATMRLQEMGLMSGQLRNQIESMQAANASGNDIWRAVTKELDRNKGAMDALSESLAGLESTHADTRQQLEAGFGQGFLEGEKAAVKSTIGVMEKMVPVAKYFGEMFGTVANAAARLKARVVEVVTGFPGFTRLVTAAAGSLLVLAAGVVTATGALAGKFLLGLMAAAVGNKALAASTAQTSASMAAQAAASRALAAAKARLALASGAVSRGEHVQAAAHARAAAAGTAAAVRTNALAASQVMLGGTLKLTGAAAGFVIRQMATMAVALAAMPVFWLATALVAAGAAALHFANRTRKAQEEMAAFQKAGKDTVANLDAQRRAIRTVNDLRAAEAAAIHAVTQAHLSYRQAVEAGDRARIAEAGKQVEAAREELEKIRATKRGSLDKTEPEIEREDALREARRRAEEGGRDFNAERGPRAERDEAAADHERKRAAMARAEAEMKAEAAVREKQRKLQQQSDDQAPLEAELLARRGALDPARESEELAEVNAQLEQIGRLRAGLEGRASGLGLASGSELMALQEKVKLYDQLKAAVDAAAEARKRIRELDPTREGWEKEGAKAGVDYKAATNAARAARAAAAAAGVGEASGFNRQDATRRMALLEQQRTEAMDPARVEEARQRAVTAELGLIQARLEGEREVAALRLRGHEREQALLAVEERKLEAARQRGRIDQESYTRQREVLEAQRDALAREEAERGKQLQTAFRIQQLERQEGEARDGGDLVKAEALRRARERELDEQARAEAERESRELALGPDARAAYVASRVEEERAGRDAERRREEDARGRSRDGARANAGSAVAALQERALRARGRMDEARRVKEEAARQQDEVDRREARRRLIDQGMGEKEAGRLADQQVKANQAARLMEQFGSGGATIVADSLAAVGGGGGVAGVDASERYLERMVRLLEQLNDNTKPDIDMGGW